MKTTLKVALLFALFITPALADDGQQGSGGRSCPPPCTAELPEDCPEPCPDSRIAPENADIKTVVDFLKFATDMYFLGR